MLETAVALVCAHLLADFVTQTDWMVEHKKKPWVMGLHIAFVVGWTALLLGLIDPWLLGVLLTSHLLMDVAKVWWLDASKLPKLLTFGFDQLVHLLTIAGLVLWRSGDAAAGLWGALPAQTQDHLWAGMAGLSGLIVAVPAGGLVIKMIATPLVPAPDDRVGASGAAVAAAAATDGLVKGGRYIGWLERGLTFMLVLYGHPEGVGFVLTAKSIFRFGDITDTSKRAQTEYIIIGTMLSFGWGLAAAIVTAAAVSHWAT